jgi:hypothetical protein
MILPNFCMSIISKDGFQYTFVKQFFGHATPAMRIPWCPFVFPRLYNKIGFQKSRKKRCIRDFDANSVKVVDDKNRVLSGVGGLCSCG